MDRLNYVVAVDKSKNLLNFPPANRYSEIV
jgi:hypothetical protein